MVETKRRIATTKKWRRDFTSLSQFRFLASKLALIFVDMMQRARKTVRFFINHNVDYLVVSQQLKNQDVVAVVIWNCLDQIIRGAVSVISGNKCHKDRRLIRYRRSKHASRQYSWFFSTKKEPLTVKSVVVRVRSHHLYLSLPNAKVPWWRCSQLSIFRSLMRIIIRTCREIYSCYENRQAFRSSTSNIPGIIITWISYR